jgi:hypothetical protein
MLGRAAKDMIEGERAVSYGVELVGVSEELGSRSAFGRRARDGGTIGRPRVS